MKGGEINMLIVVTTFCLPVQTRQSSSTQINHEGDLKEDFQKLGVNFLGMGKIQFVLI